MNKIKPQHNNDKNYSQDSSSSSSDSELENDEIAQKDRKKIRPNPKNLKEFLETWDP